MSAMSASSTTTPLDRLPRWRRLDWRLAVWISAVIICAGIVAGGWMQVQTNRVQHAYWQWQGSSLARYVADRQAQPFFDPATGQFRTNALADTAMYITMIQPSLEAYLLDATGHIIQHTLPSPERPVINQIDLQPLHRLMVAKQSDLPVWGTDPRHPQRAVLFSVTPLPTSYVGAEPPAYLYIVLQGQAGELIRQQGNQSVLSSGAWSVVLAAVVVAALVVGVLQITLSSRLRRLTYQVLSFRAGDSPMTGLPPSRGDDLDWLAQAACDMQKRIQQQFRKLEEAEHQRRELVGNVGHDLHTPLAAVQGYVETLRLAKAPIDPGLLHRHLDTALQQCHVMGRRLQELSELSRLQSHHIVTTPEPFSIAELVQDVVQGFELRASTHHVQLCLDPQMDRQARVVADIGMIERVLMNLIDNAIRHTPQGGLIALTVVAQSNKVWVRVRDSGQGIAPEALPFVFDRYWTTRPSDASGVASSRPRGGLGLAIVKRIIDLHQSTILVRSSLQKGTEVSFWLPAWAQ